MALNSLKGLKKCVTKYSLAGHENTWAPCQSEFYQHLRVYNTGKNEFLANISIAVIYEKSSNSLH